MHRSLATLALLLATAALADTASPLITAVLADDLKEIARVVEGGFPVNTANNHAWTALHLAAAEGHCESLRVLLEQGAAPRAKTRQHELQAIHLAAQKDFHACVKHLLKFGVDAQAKNKYGETASQLTMDTTTLALLSGKEL